MDWVLCTYLLHKVVCCYFCTRTEVLYILISSLAIAVKQVPPIMTEISHKSISRQPGQAQPSQWCSPAQSVQTRDMCEYFATSSADQCTVCWAERGCTQRLLTVFISPRQAGQAAWRSLACSGQGCFTLRLRQPSHRHTLVTTSSLPGQMWV